MPSLFPHHRAALTQSLLHGEEKLQKLFRNRGRSVKAGETLIFTGSDHQYVYRLRSGWACRLRHAVDGREQFILLFLPGDFFGIKSMFLCHQFDDVKTLTDAVVEVMHEEDLHRSYLADPDIALRCTWQVIEEERRLHACVFGLGRASAEERMAWVLLEFRDRLAAAERISRDALSYPMPLTQGQLADYLGNSAVHVNRVLMRLHRQGIASLRRGEVIIRDLQALKNLAGPLFEYQGTPACTPSLVAAVGA